MARPVFFGFVRFMRRKEFESKTFILPIFSLISFLLSSFLIASDRIRMLNGDTLYFCVFCCFFLSRMGQGIAFSWVHDNFEHGAIRLHRSLILFPLQTTSCSQRDATAVHAAAAAAVRAGGGEYQWEGWVGYYYL